MAFADGLELINNELAFAEHQNVELMAARGNQVVTGVGVTPQGTPDLTVAVASGTVLAGGVVVAVGADATFAGVVAGGNVLFSTLQASLTSGQSVFVFIHIDSSGVITNTDGTPAVAGQQLPPDVPEDEVIIAMLTLTEGDTTIDSVDIEDWRINVPKGGYIAGALKVTGAIVGGSIEITGAVTLPANSITGAMIEAIDQLHEIDGQSTKAFSISIAEGKIDPTAGPAGGVNTYVKETDGHDYIFLDLNGSGDDSISHGVIFDLSAQLFAIQYLNPGKTLTITSLNITVSGEASSSTNSTLEARIQYRDGTTVTISTGTNVSIGTDAQWMLKEVTNNLTDVVYDFTDIFALEIHCGYNGVNLGIRVYGLEIVYTLS